MQASNEAASVPPAQSIPDAFQQDPIAFLNTVASKSPSFQSLNQLSGPVAKWFQPETSPSAAAAAYLKAAAVHLTETASTGNAESETVVALKQFEVVIAVGICATLCRETPNAISSSGIIPTLANLIFQRETEYTGELSVVAVEFLQCALIAGHYRYAARLVTGTWPRPDGTANVKTVLRYYYIRGMIHLGCNDFVMSHRCFWTCLSIPAETVCKVAVDAWKKLVLVQCVMSDSRKPNTNKTVLPKTMPTCVGRLLASCKEESTTSKSVGTKRTQPPGGEMSSPQEPPQSKPRTAKKSSPEAMTCACYIDIVAAFYGGDKSKFQKLVSDHSATFHADGNWELVEQCLTQLHINQVRHISSMYSVVPTSKAAQLLGMSGSSVEQDVAKLLVQCGVPCEIQEDGMIEFHEPLEDSESNLNDIAEWLELLERVQQLDVNILTSTRYQALMKQESTAAGNDTKIAAGPRTVADL